MPGEAWLATGRVQDHLLLLEPGSGRTTACSLEAVADLAERIVLIKPLSEPAQAGLRDTMFARLRPVLWELGIASVVINLLALATPLFLMTVYNKVINHGALQTLDVLVFGMVTLFLFEWALRALRGYVASHTGGRLDAALGSEVVHHLVHMPLRTFERMSTGQILERTRQLDSIRQFFASQMPLLLVDLAFVGLFLAVLCYLDLRLGAITLAAMPLFWLLSMLARRRHHGLIEAGFKAAAAKASSLGETISQALTVKALGLEPEMERRFKQRLADAATNTFRAGHLGGMIASSGQVLQQGVALLIVYVGARAIIAGELSIGALIAATILAARALAPMRQVVGAWQQLHTVRAAFARLDELLNEPTERAAAPGPALQVRGHLLFEGVVYRYSEDAEPALEGIDLEIAPGQVLGVAGPAGLRQEHVDQAAVWSGSSRARAHPARRPRSAPVVARRCCVSRSGWCPRRCSCSRARSPRTSRSARWTGSSNGSWPPPSSSARTISSSACPAATTPGSASAAAASRPASAS